MSGDPDPPRPRPQKPRRLTRAQRDALRYEDFPGFEDAWQSYPRKEEKRAALEVWAEKGLEPYARAIVAKIEHLKQTSHSWQEIKFVKYMARWLSKDGLLDEPVPAPVEPAKYSMQDRGNILLREKLRDDGLDPDRLGIPDPLKDHRRVDRLIRDAEMESGTVIDITESKTRH